MADETDGRATFKRGRTEITLPPGTTDVRIPATNWGFVVFASVMLICIAAVSITQIIVSGSCP
jgi:hypothetical protein